jgi:methyl-accepting chemotaxis protein
MLKRELKHQSGLRREMLCHFAPLVYPVLTLGSLLAGSAGEFTMTNASKPFKRPQEGFLARIGSPEIASRVVGPTRDISAYLDRIEQASRTLVANAERVQELEELLYGLKKRQDETNAELEASRKLAAELEREVAAQTIRATEAESLASSAANQAKRSEQALRDANSKLDTLTGALDAAFSEGASAPAPLRAAA